MKKICEFTEEELLKLAINDEAISKQIDFECAIEGVPMLPPHPGPKPVVDKIKADMTVYEVCGLFFEDSKDATRVLEAFNEAGNIYKTDDYGDDKHLVLLAPGDYHFPKVETQLMVSNEAFKAKKEEKKANKEIINSWNELNNAYLEASEKRKGIVDKVYERIHDAEHHSYVKDSIRNEFRRYLELAEDNRTVAMNFMLKAKPEVRYDYPQLIEELCPGYGEPEAA